MNYNDNVSDYISKATQEQIMILEHIRQLIHESVKEVSETIKWGFPVFLQKKDFAYMRFSKHHITLGFYNIDKIQDPNNLLEGSGNTLKHIKIRTIQDLNFDLVSEWLKQITS